MLPLSDQKKQYSLYILGIIAFLILKGTFLSYPLESDNQKLSRSEYVSDVNKADDGDFEISRADQLIRSVRMLPAPESPETPEIQKEHKNTDLPGKTNKGKTNKPRIAIVIDDIGIDKSRSAKAIDLEGPLTIAMLPYATQLSIQARKAQSKGHELLVHMPMEPLNSDLNPGPIALYEDMPESEIHAVLNKALDAFKGFAGINNHMGSRFTSNRKAMQSVMEILTERDLFYLDSLTINASKGALAAAHHDVAYARRDVFLDHVATKAYVETALKKLEALALQKGSAIAIGHPKDVTISSLKEWIPAARERGFEFVPVSKLVRNVNRSARVSEMASYPIPPRAPR